MTSSNPLKPDGLQQEKPHLVLSTIALNILSLALPVMTLQVYDRILPNPDSGTLPVLMAGVLVAVLLEICLRLARAWMMGWNGAVYEHAVSSNAMRHVLEADVTRSGSVGIGEFLNRFSSIGKLKEFHNGYALVTMTEAAFVPVFLGVIFYIAQPLALITLALLGAFVAITVVQGRVMRRELEDRDMVDDRRYDFLIECLKSIHTVKSFAVEQLLSRRYESLQEKSGLASFRASGASTASFNAGTSLSHLMIAVLMAVGAVLSFKGMVTTGALIATLQLSGRLMQPVQRALVLWARYQDYRLAQEKVSAIFSLPLRENVEAVELPASAGKLSVRNLSYGGVLKDISFSIGTGEVIAISGPAGVGKTELLEILSGLHAPDSGEILIDGTDIHAYPPEELTRHIGYMPTEGVVFRGTIRDNLTCFGHIAEARAHEVTSFLGVDRDVARLPSGFDTVLQADGADQVAPGLRQRIAMTRVLAARPRIILFDEADRMLDREGYNLVFSMLAKLSRRAAIILVSDDANITALATRRYELKDGALVEKSAAEERKIAYAG